MSAEKIFEILKEKTDAVACLFVDDYLDNKPRILYNNNKFINKIGSDLSKISIILDSRTTPLSQDIDYIN